MAQNTRRLKFFMQENADEKDARLVFDGVIVRAMYPHRKAMARGMVVRLSQTDFLVLGSGFEVQLLNPAGQGIPLARVDRGRFEGDTWRPLLPMRREREDRSLPFRVVEPQVIKVVLEL